MYKIKFKNILKYAVSKTILTNLLVLVVSTNGFNWEGKQQMMGFTVIVGFLSLAVLCLFLLVKRKGEFKSGYYPFFMVIFALVVNDVAGMALGIDTNIISVILQRKPWLITYKLCDVESVIFSSYLWLVLPIKRIPSNEKSKQ
jgi:hypothetical protein